MKMKFWSSGIFFFLICLFVLYRTLQIPKRPIHYHANFAVFIDGKHVDFSKPEFMHITPCADEYVHSDDPQDNVHLHDQKGNVVHVHAQGIDWRLFFSTIDFDVSRASRDKGISVYQNGKQVDPSILERQIGDRDQLLIRIGSLSSRANLEFEKVGSDANKYDEGKLGIEKCGAESDLTLWQRFKIAFGL